MKKIERCVECGGIIIKGKYETYCQECGLVAEDKSIKLGKASNHLDPEFVDKKNKALREENKK